MKNTTRIITALIALVMIVTSVPLISAAPADAKSVIVKDIVEFGGNCGYFGNGFYLDNTVYDINGDTVASVPCGENEIIYTVGDNCVITIVYDMEDLEGVESFDDLKYSYKIYEISEGKAEFKREIKKDGESPENSMLVAAPYIDGKYTTVIDLSIDLESFEYEFYGYELLDSYGNTVYADDSDSFAVYVGGDMMVVESVDGGCSLIKDIDGEWDVSEFEYTIDALGENGLLLITDGVLYGLMDIDGKVILEPSYNYIEELGSYYIGYNILDEENFTYSCDVFDLNGELVIESENEIVYVNDDIYVTYTSDEYVMIDRENGEAVAKGKSYESVGEYHYINGGVDDEYYTVGGSVYNSEGKLVISGALAVSSDPSNGTFIAADTDGVFRRYNSDGSIIETFEEMYVTAEYDFVSIAETEEEAYLRYKGKVISDDHYMSYTSFAVDGCEVYIMLDYDEETDEEVYIAYIIDGEKCPFFDVQENWAYSSIMEVYGAGIMNGTGGIYFSHKADVSRAQVVTTLWRLAGEPEVKADSDEMKFTDVPESKWYTEAVKWAADAGIVNGVGGELFAPDRTITRGEVAAIFYRYAEYMGRDTAGRADVSGFADAGELKSWNRDAFAWCVSEGIINGKSAGGDNAALLAPNDVLTRAEIATVICRYGIPE